MSKLFLAGETHRKRVDRKTVKKHFTNSPSMDLQLSVLRCSYVSGSLTPLAVSLGPRGVMTLGVQKTIQKTSAGRVNMTLCHGTSWHRFMMEGFQLHHEVMVRYDMIDKMM